MSALPRRPRPYRPLSWLAGLLVLGGLGWTLATLVTPRRPEDVSAAFPPVPDPVAAGHGVPAPPPAVRTIRGVVRQPDGSPAAGASVEIHRALTEGPEWRSQRIDEAITVGDGAFVFALQVRHDLLIRFSHPSFSGGFVPVPARLDDLSLELQPGFELTGSVTTDVGVPLGGVRVAVESTIDQQRRVEVTVSEPNGDYRFGNLQAGTVRLVARHERWRAVADTVRIGAARRHDIRFTARASSPLRGRVVTAGQVPIPAAIVELLPTNGRSGLVDPITATTDADGRFQLVGLARGPMSLLVRHPEHGVLRRAVSVGATPTEPVLELPPRSAVSGRLLAGDAEGRTVAGTALRAVDAAGEIHHTTSDDSGAFAFASRLSPGRASLSLPDAALAFLDSQASEMTVYVEERQNTGFELEVAAPAIVRGRCVDEAATPLAGVLVFGTAQLTAARLFGPDLASYIGAVGQEVALTLGSERDLLLAVTGADGRFEFMGQEPGPLLLRCQRDGRASRRVRVTVPPPGAPALLDDIALPPGCRLEGAVRSGARPLVGVEVSVVGSEAQHEVLSGPGGRFAVTGLLAGDYRVRARLPSEAGQEERSVTVTPGAPSAAVQLQVPPGRTVTGFVVTEQGGERHPVANALVAVRGGGQPTQTDGDGRFALELPTRATRLQVSLADNSRTATVTVPPGQREITIELETPATGMFLAQIAGLPGRKRVPAVLLRVQRRDGGGGDRPRWIDVQNGELRWPLCPVGPCRIEIRCEGYVPFVAEHDFVAQEEHRLDPILLEPGAFVRGLVVDEAGRPIANARAFLGEEADLDLFEPTVRSGADGQFRLSGVCSRAATLVAFAPGFAPTVRALQLPADVLAREPVRIVLRPGSAIAVQVTGGIDTALVQLLREGQPLASAVPDDTGRVEFLDRAPGAYEVRLHGGEATPVQVLIERPRQTVRVTL